MRWTRKSVYKNIRSLERLCVGLQEVQHGAVW
jgi:hypothetical protein